MFSATTRGRWKRCGIFNSRRRKGSASALEWLNCFVCVLRWRFEKWYFHLVEMVRQKPSSNWWLLHSLLWTESRCINCVALCFSVSFSLSTNITISRFNCIWFFNCHNGTFASFNRNWKIISSLVQSNRAAGRKALETNLSKSILLSATSDWGAFTDDEREWESFGGWKIELESRKNFFPIPIDWAATTSSNGIMSLVSSCWTFFSLFDCERWEICSTREKKRGSVVSTTITIDNWHQASTWLNRWKLNKIRWPVTRQYSKQRAPNSDCFVYFKLFPILPLKWMLSISTAAARVWTKKEEKKIIFIVSSSVDSL